MVFRWQKKSELCSPYLAKSQMDTSVSCMAGEISQQHISDHSPQQVKVGNQQLIIQPNKNQALNSLASFHCCKLSPKIKIDHSKACKLFS